MNDIEILMHAESKYLGINSDRYVYWTSYIDSLCSKLSSQFFYLSRFSGYQNAFLV